MTHTVVCGVHICAESRETIKQMLERALDARSLTTVFTPNPEMLVFAEKKETMKKILNGSSLNICDGFGIVLVTRLAKQLPPITRYPGSDCFVDLCALAEERGKTVFLLGTGKREILERAQKNLEQQFPKLRIVGIHPGIPIIQTQGKELYTVSSEKNDYVIDTIIGTAPDILFVAFGHGKQEWWIEQFAKELPSVKIAIGIGGGIDYIAKKIQRAPRLFRTFGLEWVWRLFGEPWRLPRIITALFIFPYRYFISRRSHL